MNKWSLIKISLFIIFGLFSISETPEFVENQPPIIIFPLLAFGAFIFSLAFFKGVSTQTKLTIGKISSPFKNIFHDPLPSYHFAAIAVLISGLCGVLRDLINNTPIDSASLFELTMGIGVYPSILIANKYFIKEPKTLKKV